MAAPALAYLEESCSDIGHMSRAVTHNPSSMAEGLAWRSGPASSRGDRNFRWALSVALLAHGLFLLGFYTDFYADKRRELGDPSGVAGAISIELATDADINSVSAVADRAGDLPRPTFDAGADAPPQLTPPQPSQQQQSAPPQKTTPTEQQTAELLEAVPPVPTAAPTPKATEQQKAPAKAETPPSGLFKLREAPEPVPHVGEDKKTPPAPKAAPPQKEAKPPEPRPPQPKPSTNKLTAKLDLTLPQSAFTRQTFTTAGGAAGIERPAGITRSGENDDFARGVIRALQRTMPQLKDTLGQVTVRITLDSRGNLASTEVVRKSTVAGLDQNVVFATKQSSFPIPPRKHVSADLVFVVTYIYR